MPKPLTDFQRRVIRFGSQHAELRGVLGRLINEARQGGYTGNPDGKDIYKNKIDHGYDQPLAGGTDVMKRLQDQLLHEQGRPPRDPNPVLKGAKR
jgi:hypothetical protein